MSGGADDDQVTRSAQVLIQASQLTVGELTCYRDSPHISLLGPALASADTLVSLHPPSSHQIFRIFSDRF